MTVYFHVVSNSDRVKNTYVLNSDQDLRIEIEELDWVDFELELEEPISSTELQLVIGSTPFLFDEAVKIKESFYYKINIEHLRDKLPGNEAHISKEFYETKIGQRRFSRLFLNEIGLSKIYFYTNLEEYYVGSINISSKKVSKENYGFITEYLIYNGYFDSNNIYKVVIDGHQSNFKNSLIESLRKLIEFLDRWFENLYKFKSDPIRSINAKSSLAKFNSNYNINLESINWLIDNPDTLQETSPFNYDSIEANNKLYQVEEILVSENHYLFNSYENRIIHGFINNLLKVLSDKELQLSNKSVPRVRVTTFREFLINCFNDLIQKYFDDARKKLLRINTFYKKELPVNAPLYEFPKKIDGFFSKSHYRETLELIKFSTKIFSINLGINNFKLEIESFDKLFEVYCFYLIKDIIQLNFGINKSVFEKVSLDYRDFSNKDAGRYNLDLTNGDYKFELYYEMLPNDFIQFTNSVTPYRPDFILGVVFKHIKYFFILDAKFKNYNSRTLEDDLSLLTLKYLHKIGLKVDSKATISGLFTMSLSPRNKTKTIFSRLYDLNGRFPRTPQIGNMEIDPKSFDLKANGVVEIINYCQELNKMTLANKA